MGWGSSQAQHSLTIAYLQDVRSFPGAYYFTNPIGLSKKGFPSVLATVQPMRNGHNAANEKPLYLRLLVYSNGLYVYNSLPNFLPFLYKRVYLSFSLGLVLSMVLLQFICLRLQFSAISG